MRTLWKIPVFICALSLCGCASAPEQHAGLSLEKVKHAQRVLSPVARETPVIFSDEFNGQAEVFLKLENLQKTGAFKLRGAYYKISQLSAEQKKRGVATCSTGNHAQGVAFAAKQFGLKATVFMPKGTAPAKVRATRDYGAQVVLVEGSFEDAVAACEKFVAQNGATYVAPYNDIDVIAGQGTIGLEILAQVPDVDAVVVPVGGGGLISGIAFTIKTLKPSCKVYGVQSAAVPSMLVSRERGQIATVPAGTTIADGIKVRTPGKITYALCQQYVDGIVTVSDAQIKDAINTLLHKQKVVAEGAGAVSFAALQSGLINIAGKRVVCVISGGNIDQGQLKELIAPAQAQ